MATPCSHSLALSLSCKPSHATVASSNQGNEARLRAAGTASASCDLPESVLKLARHLRRSGGHNHRALASIAMPVDLRPAMREGVKHQFFDELHHLRDIR